MLMYIPVDICILELLFAFLKKLLACDYTRLLKSFYFRFDFYKEGRKYFI